MIEENEEELKVTNLRFTEKEVGALFKQSKCIYDWKFTLDGVRRTVTLEHSKLTGKRVVIFDNKTLVSSSKYTYNFAYYFPIDKHNILIQQTSYSYELKIDGKSFHSLINQEKLERYNIIREDYLKDHPIIEKPKKSNPDDGIQFVDQNGNIIELPDSALRSQLIQSYREQLAMQQEQANQVEENEEEEDQKDETNGHDDNDNKQETPIEPNNNQSQQVDLLNMEQSLDEHVNNNLLDIPIQVPQSINDVNKNLNIGELTNFNFT